MYIENIIILNFVIDYILLKSTSIILKNNIKNINIIYSCLFGEISLLYLFININYFIMIIFKIIIGLIMIYITFGYEDRKHCFISLIWFYLLSFFLGGILYYFKINNLVKYKYYLLLIPILMNTYNYFIIGLKNIISYKYKVNIYLNNGNILYLDGYLDTGNTLLDPYTNNKVIIINKIISEDFFLVPYETINGSSLIRCFKPKRVFIEGIGERKDIVVGIINKKFNGYNCLLNGLLLEE